MVFIFLKESVQLHVFEPTAINSFDAEAGIFYEN